MLKIVDKKPTQILHWLINNRVDYHLEKKKSTRGQLTIVLNRVHDRLNDYILGAENNPGPVCNPIEEFPLKKIIANLTSPEGITLSRHLSPRILKVILTSLEKKIQKDDIMPPIIDIMSGMNTDQLDTIAEHLPIHTKLLTIKSDLTDDQMSRFLGKVCNSQLIIGKSFSKNQLKVIAQNLQQIERIHMAMVDNEDTINHMRFFLKSIPKNDNRKHLITIGNEQDESTIKALASCASNQIQIIPTSAASIDTLKLFRKHLPKQLEITIPSYKTPAYIRGYLCTLTAPILLMDPNWSTQQLLAISCGIDANATLNFNTYYHDNHHEKLSGFFHRLSIHANRSLNIVLGEQLSLNTVRHILTSCPSINSVSFSNKVSTDTLSTILGHLQPNRILIVPEGLSQDKLDMIANAQLETEIKILGFTEDNPIGQREPQREEILHHTPNEQKTDSLESSVHKRNHDDLGIQSNGIFSMDPTKKRRLITSSSSSHHSSPEPDLNPL